MSEKRTVYLDHAATTPLHLEVFSAMEPFLKEQFGNPSSSYSLGRAARRAVDDARETIAAVLGCSPQEILFTAGGTESVNLAIQGVVREAGAGYVVSSAIEHAAVVDTIAGLQKEMDDRLTSTLLQPTADGHISGEALRQALITPPAHAEPILVSLMLASNEIGSVSPVAEFVTATKQINPTTLFHTDACQATGYLDLDVQKLGVDLMSINASKIYGPKGVGALYVKRGVQLTPLTYGGGQERGLRPGTENVAGIVGFAKAVELAEERRVIEVPRQTALRDRLRDGIRGSIPHTSLNGDPDNRLPNNVNILFADVEGEALLFSLDAAGIAASMGSACAAGSLEPSHVLMAMGLSKQDARKSIRFSLGQDTTQEDIDYVLEILPPMIERLRNL